MLLIISDLHLSDGSLVPTIDQGSFHLLHEQVTQHAFKASWRTENVYRPIDSIDIVLLGDNLDLIQTDYWLKNDVRPWEDPNSRRLLDSVNKIVDRTLRANCKSAEILRDIALAPSICIPQAVGTGKPACETKKQAVPVRIHYMVGQSDWLLHLPGPGYDLVRQKVIRHLGLHNRFDQPFPHRPEEAGPLHRVLETHRVHAMHGDESDPVSCGGNRRKPSLSDLLRIEVLQRYVLETIGSAGDALPKQLVNALNDLLALHPIPTAANQIVQILQRSISSPSLLNKFCSNWNQLLRAALADDCQGRVECTPDLQEKLLRQLTIDVRASLRQNVIADHGQVERVELEETEGISSQLLLAAECDPAVQNPAIRHIVYGHSHQHQIYSITRSTQANRSGGNQLVDCTYFNAGSWQPGNPKTRSGEERVSCQHQQAAFHFFYKDDERCGRPFEVWQGILAPPALMPELKVTCGVSSSIRAVRSLAKATKLAGPHFLALPGSTSQSAENTAATLDVN